MSFLERFRKPQSNQLEPLVEEPANETPVDKRSLEDAQRLEALKASPILEIITDLNRSPYVEVINASTWHPTVCVLDRSYNGDKPKYDCFDIVAKPKGELQIGYALLGREEARDFETVDEATVKAHETARPVFGNPHQIFAS